MATNQNTKGIFKTHYEGAEPIEVDILEVISEASVKVRFPDGNEEVTMRRWVKVDGETV